MKKVAGDPGQSFRPICKYCRKPFNSKRHKKYCSPEHAKAAALERSRLRYRKMAEGYYKTTDIPGPHNFEESK